VTESTGNAIARAVVQISVGISSGRLYSRLCHECGDVNYPGHMCAEIAPLKAKAAPLESAADRLPEGSRSGDKKSLPQ